MSPYLAAGGPYRPTTTELPFFAEVFPEPAADILRLLEPDDTVLAEQMCASARSRAAPS
ncbi:hypothetical protein ABZ883_40900 [Streptomyces sp. NPDC046977]|uniref:hypothetical protein n=1 Tax=Streptomyces sp. NPDC046977 TaxID=3154703 RepID=UPI0033C2A5C0